MDVASLEDCPIRRTGTDGSFLGTRSDWIASLCVAGAVRWLSEGDLPESLGSHRLEMFKADPTL